MEKQTYYMSRSRGGAGKPSLIIEAIGDPEKYTLTLKFYYTPVNKNIVYHEYSVVADQQDIDFLLSSLTSAKNLDKKNGINWHGNHLDILKVNRANLSEEIPRRFVMRIVWQDTARSLKIQPVKISPEEKIYPIEFRLSGNDVDCLVMLIKRVINMAQEINYKIPLLTKKLIEELVPILRQNKTS